MADIKIEKVTVKVTVEKGAPTEVAISKPKDPLVSFALIHFGESEKIDAESGQYDLTLTRRQDDLQRADAKKKAEEQEKAKIEAAEKETDKQALVGVVQ